MLKNVDTSEVVRGPHDAPGHWLVTAAKLVIEVGKIGLQVKFALIDYYLLIHFLSYFSFMYMWREEKNIGRLHLLPLCTQQQQAFLHDLAF